MHRGLCEPPPLSQRVKTRAPTRRGDPSDWIHSASTRGLGFASRNANIFEGGDALMRKAGTQLRPSVRQCAPDSARTERGERLRIKDTPSGLLRAQLMTCRGPSGPPASGSVQKHRAHSRSHRPEYAPAGRTQSSSPQKSRQQVRLQPRHHDARICGQNRGDTAPNQPPYRQPDADAEHDNAQSPGGSPAPPPLEVSMRTGRAAWWRAQVRACASEIICADSSGG